MNLWEARGRVKEVKPNAPNSQVDGFINRRVRNVLDTRTWSDTMKMGMIIIPAATIAGTVTMTQGSRLVTGIGTAWPVNDLINGLITKTINQNPGFVEIFPGPGVLDKIEAGSLLLLDQENAAITEILTVQSVGRDRFMAYCRFSHDINATLQASTLTGQQFATATYTFTVGAVLSPVSIQLDMPFGGPPEASVPYMIRKQYCRISPTARFVDSAWDAIAGQPIGTQRDESWITMVDPQRTSSGNPLELATCHPSPGGVMQWELWPFQTSNYAIAVLYQDGWPTLSYDTDLLPPFINAEVMISGACADALRTKVIKAAGGKDDYYDPQSAMVWEGDYGRLLEAATQSDQGRRLTYLTNWKEFSQGNGAWNWYRGQASYQPSAWGAGN